MSNAFFHLSRPMAPRLIQCLYYVALVFIAIGLVLGLVRAVRLVAAPPTMTAAAPANPGAPATAQPNGPPGMTAQAPLGPRMMRMRRFGGPMMRRGGPLMRGPAFLRGAPPALRAGAMVLLVLLRTWIAWMVVRILAEIGAAILAMRPIERSVS